jgi:hypothetical protein
VREKWEQMLNMREYIRQAYEEKGVLEAVPKRNYQYTTLHFMVDSIDSEEAALLETLEGDLEDFFFGVPIVIETHEQNKKRKSTPIKTIKYQFDSQIERRNENSGANEKVPIKYRFTARVYAK